MTSDYLTWIQGAIVFLRLRLAAADGIANNQPGISNVQLLTLFHN